LRHSSLARRLVVAAAAGVAATLAVATAGYAATWHVFHPPFTAQSSVPYAPLASVSAVSATDVWAVGRADSASLTEHWNGTGWSTVALPAGPCDVFESSCQLTGVSADRAGDVIAVGTATLNDPSGWLPAALAYRWTGTAWAALPVPASVNAWALAHVATFSAADAWAVGANTGAAGGSPAATHWDGTAWTSVATPVLTNLNLTMTAIAGSSGHDVWAVGTAQSSGYHHQVRHSVAMHYDGTGWTAATVPDTSGLVSLSVDSATDAWALGLDGSVLHFDGTSWTVVTHQSMGAATIAATSASDVWIGGVWTGSSWAVAHYNGSTWTTSAIPSGIDVFSGAAAVPGGRLWIAGAYYPSNAVTAPAILSN
jgi:hypothetical protein